MFSGIFIDWPRFAIVIAVVITLAGLIAIRSIPIAQFPDISCRRQASLTARNHPGADPGGDREHGGPADRHKEYL